MNPSLSLFSWSALLYSGAFLFGLAGLLQGRRYPRSILYTLITAGFLLQTWALYQRGITIQHVPLGNLFELLQFLTWSLTLLYLLIGPSFHLNVLGFFTSGLSGGLSGLSLLRASWDVPHPPGLFQDSPWIALHALLALFSYGVFAVLALVCAMYLIQNYGLRSKRSQNVFSFLPPLKLLSDISGRLLAIGIILLTLSVCLGWLHQLTQAENTFSLKIGSTTLVWGLYLIVLIRRRTHQLVATSFGWACVLLFILALGTLIPVTQKIETLRLRPIDTVPVRTSSAYAQ